MIADIIAVILGLAGLAGCILPAVPGPPLSWAGLLVLYFYGGTLRDAGQMSTALLLTMLGITVVVSILDYVIPAKMTKVTGGSEHASRGAMAGLLIGIVFTPVGMILGSFLGALAAEAHYTGKPLAKCLSAAFGTFIGTILGTGLKLIASVVMFVYIIIYL